MHISISNSILLLFFSLSTSTPLVSTFSVPYLEQLTVDGNPVDWGNLSTIEILPSDTSLSQQGAFGHEDLYGKLRMAWNENGVFFGIERHDNSLDWATIPRDSVRWTTPSGQGRDRMYFFDNVALGLRSSDQYYKIWLAPTLEADKVFQFGTIRPLPFRAEAPATEVIVAPEVAVQRRGANGVFIEVGISWTDLGQRLGRDDQINVLLILTDSDEKELSLKEKMDKTKYLAWQEDVVLVGGRN